MKKYLVQIKYPSFAELFESKVNGEELDIDLLKVVPNPSEDKDVITLDLSSSIRDNYSIFPVESGDLTLIQVHHNFIVSCHQGSQIHWLRFNSDHLFDHIYKEDLLEQIIPFVHEDKHIYLNSILADLCRNDFSYSEMNKKVKYAKVSILMDFIKKHLPMEYKRVILDETIMGDVEVENIPMAFRFSGMRFLELVKINNVSKVMMALEEAKIIDTKFKFQANAHFFNNEGASSDVHLVFGENGMKMDYQVMRSKNYIFDLGEKEYPVTFGDKFKVAMSGKFSIFGGDERDLMIN